MTWKGHGKTCVERCCELTNRTTQQLNKVSTSTQWWPSLQRGRIEIRWRIVKSMLSNCSEMLILGSHWKTWYSMVSEQTCTIDHKMDQSMLQTIISFDLWHSSYMWVPTVLSCGKHCQTMQVGTASRLRFCRRSWGLNTSGGTLCFFGSHTFVPISWMCKNQTSVSHSWTESEIISLNAGLRLDGLPALELWDLIVSVLGNTTQTSERPGRPVHEPTWGSCSTSQTSITKKSHGMIDECWFYFLKRPFFSSGSVVENLWRQRSSDQDDHKGKKPHNETCFQDPQSCSWLVVW